MHHAFLHQSLPPNQLAASIEPPCNEDLSSIAAVQAQYIAQHHPLSMADEMPLQQPLAPPTMHPNLVSTLKSIIAQEIPLQTASDRLDPSSNPFLGVRTNLFAPVLNQTLTTSALKETQNSVSDLYPCSSSDPPAAAIVPIDVIQNPRPFKCGFAGCDKTFRNPQTLKMHRKTHYGDDFRTYSFTAFPPTCKAGHNKKIPSKCPVCKQTFVGLYELRRHFGRKHSEGEKAHGCRKCGKRFYIEVDLRDHKKLCGEPLRCKCGMKFAFKCNLVSHKRTHPECQDLQECKGMVQATGKQRSPTDGGSSVPKATQDLKQYQNLQQQEEQISCASSSLTFSASGQSFLPTEWLAKSQCQDPWLQVFPWVTNQDNLEKGIVDVVP